MKLSILLLGSLAIATPVVAQTTATRPLTVHGIQVHPAADWLDTLDA